MYFIYYIKLSKYYLEFHIIYGQYWHVIFKYLTTIFLFSWLKAQMTVFKKILKSECVCAIYCGFKMPGKSVFAVLNCLITHFSFHFINSVWTVPGQPWYHGDLLLTLSDRFSKYHLYVFQHWDVFKVITEVFILVPALVGLKGNLEMTLASRLSTAVCKNSYTVG